MAPLKLSIARPEPIAAPPLLPKFPPGTHCVQHRHLPAVNQCKTCGAFMCDTCTFILPGSVNLCPECATSTKASINPQRKKILIGSYVCAAWCTFMVAAISLGIFSRVARDAASATALNLLIAITLTIPSITGLGLAVSTLERRRPASIPIWIAIIWNALFVARHIFLVSLNLLR
jgi:hypothetical protein